MRAALDANLLVYAEGFGDDKRVSATRLLLDQLSEADLVIPLQCLGELFRVLTGKAGRPAGPGRGAGLDGCLHRARLQCRRLARGHGSVRGPSAGQLGCAGAQRGGGGWCPTAAPSITAVRNGRSSVSIVSLGL